MYRPKGFKNPYSFMRGRPFKHITNANPDYAYEAGADAMLEGLRKRGKYCVNSVGRLKTHKNKLGWLVFIPEEGSHVTD